MAESLSPDANPTQVKKQRATILSPVTTFVLGSNNDNLERAQARAVRAACIRRKPVILNDADDTPASAFPGLGHEQIMDLFQNCIKLASENKINQTNTWELNLIDHLADIIKVEEHDPEINFQKASCTLEAGVKIYSTRVDSVHAYAYKVLGAINRVGQDLEQEDGNTHNSQRKQSTKKDHEQKFSPLSTLESSFDNLNLKKLDVAFTVDPLYHQTSAQFDEGGAKGLLLNNLGVYGGCRVLFDSLEIPANCMSCSPQTDKIETIDISYAKECVEQMAINILKKKEISPTLGEIVNMFDDKRPPDTFSFAPISQEPDYDDYAPDGGDQNDNFGTWDFVNDNEGTYEREEEPQEENEQYESNDSEVDDNLIRIDDFLFPRRRFTTRQNAWAGPDHWKYQKAKGPEASTKETGSPLLSKKPRNKKQLEPDIDFMEALENDIIDPFVPPKNPNSLLLFREPCNTMLPEDCHYQPENLVKLFLLPNVFCFGKKRGKRNSDEVHQEANQSWGDEYDDCGIGDQFDDGDAYSNVDDSLVSQPRKVEKINIQYDKKSKQVNVHLLKDTLWSTIQDMRKSTEDEGLSFKDILSSFKTATSSNDDVTPHLSFICILHLANEHALTLNSSPDMVDVIIHL